MNRYINTNTRISSFKAKDYIEKSLSSMLGALSLSLANISLSIISTRFKLVIKEEG